MVGQSLTIIGEVATAISSFTKTGKPFVSATLEDISGRVEVVAWSNVYEGTKELWEEGNILIIQGKVRVREDRAQLNCDKVERYQPGIAMVAPSAAKPLDEPKVVEKTVTPAAPTESLRLVISVTQTSDENSDVAHLYSVVNTLKEFPGQDEVILHLQNNGDIERLRLPSAGYCPELHQRLVKIVGEEGVRVETNTP
ncbi:MAG: hypothetical protein HY528_05110 [Chloroflexi bacterium]|nr:hypothetical protein [Chloroflexota bacterium]